MLKEFSTKQKCVQSSDKNVFITNTTKLQHTRLRKGHIRYRETLINKTVINTKSIQKVLIQSGTPKTKTKLNI